MSMRSWFSRGGERSGQKSGLAVFGFTEGTSILAASAEREGVDVHVLG
jgi:hypothetical protein